MRRCWCCRTKPTWSPPRKRWRDRRERKPMKANVATDAGVPQHGSVRKPPRRTHFGMIGAVSFVHMLNDMMQSVIVAIYPLLKGDFHLSFFQIGAIRSEERRVGKECSSSWS